MTITSYDNRRTFAGNGVTTAFSFPPPFTVNTDLVVQIQAADGSITTKTLGSDYTVSSPPYTSGGTVTMTVAPATGTTLIIYRAVPITQGVTFQDGGPLPAATVNGALDRITMWGQWLQQLLQNVGTLVTTTVDGLMSHTDKAKLDGIVIGSTVQTQNSFLQDIASMNWVQGDIMYYNGTDLTRLAAGTSGQYLKTQGAASAPVWTTIAGGGDMLSTNNLNDVANKATSRTNLGVAIGTNVEAWNARLDDIAGITYAQGDILYFNGSVIVKLAAGTSGQFLKTNGAAANPSWATASGSGSVTSVDMSVPTGFAVSGNPITTTGTLALTWSGFTTGDILQASGASAMSKLAAVATGNVLISGGVGTVSSWGKVGLGTHVSGTLGAANGGTAQSSYTTGDILYASATNTLSKLTAGSNGNVLTLASGVPSWAAGGSGATVKNTLFATFTTSGSQTIGSWVSDTEVGLECIGAGGGGTTSSGGGGGGSSGVIWYRVGEIAFPLTMTVAAATATLGNGGPSNVVDNNGKTICQAFGGHAGSTSSAAGGGGGDTGQGGVITGGTGWDGRSTGGNASNGTNGAGNPGFNGGGGGSTGSGAGGASNRGGGGGAGAAAGVGGASLLAGAGGGTGGPAGTTAGAAPGGGGSATGGGARGEIRVYVRST